MLTDHKMVAYILNYAKTNSIKLTTKDGQLIMNGRKSILTDDFVEATKTYKHEIIWALGEGERSVIEKCGTISQGFWYS